MKLVFMGTPDFAVPSLDTLIKSDHTDVLAVFTRPDRKSGRGMELHATAVKKLALEAEIPVYQPEKLSDPENIKILEKLNPDVICVVAYSQFLRKNVLELPKFGCLNVHGSILPKYRGAAPIQWAIASGESETGVSIMKLVQKMDAGPVYAIGKTPITETDNSQSVHDRLSEIGARLLLETLIGIEKGEAVFEKQDESLATYAPQLSKSDGKINWDDSAQYILNRLKGFTPWPGAFTNFNEKTVTLTRARLVNSVVGCCEREIGDFWLNDPNSLFVQCGKGVLEIQELKPQGKKIMNAVSFYNGLKNIKNYRFS